MLHPSIEAAHQAVMALCRSGRARHPDEARRMIRVEVDHDGRDELLQTGRIDVNVQMAVMAYMRDEKPGPLNINGVDYYVVRTLPAPGWRIVNPLEGQRVPPPNYGGHGPITSEVLR